MHTAAVLLPLTQKACSIETRLDRNRHRMFSRTPSIDLSTILEPLSNAHRPDASLQERAALASALHAVCSPELLSTQLVQLKASSASNQVRISTISEQMPAPFRFIP